MNALQKKLLGAAVANIRLARDVSTEKAAQRALLKLAAEGLTKAVAAFEEDLNKKVPQ